VFWPGSEAEIDGVRPRYWRPFDNAFTAEERVDELLGRLDLPDGERPAFLSFYMDDVDIAGHRHGPDSHEVGEAIARVDHALGRLVAGLEQRGLFTAVTMIVVSDHGMAASPAHQRIYLDDYVPLDTVTVVDWSPVLLASSKTGDDEALFRALEGKHPHLTVYRRADLPERMHFKSHPRVPGVIAVADEGWNIARRPRPGDRPGWPSHGTHGYDNIVGSMRGIFVAHGPTIVPGVRVASIDAVDVYELMAAALEVVPAPNDGDFETIAPLMRSAVAAAARARRAVARGVSRSDARPVGVMNTATPR
jgi:predicted AlkP superfamily pyrophosphatase or phosphodiesterase